MELAEKAKKILVIEDSRTDLILLDYMLSKTEGGNRYAITSVPRLTDAFLQLEKEWFDVILLDMHLPDVNGIDLVTTLHAEAPDVPIIVYSGMDDYDLKQECLLAGAVNYLVKGREDGESMRDALNAAVARRKPLAMPTPHLMQT